MTGCKSRFLPQLPSIMPSHCDCGCGGQVAKPGHRVKACRDRLLAQGHPCPQNTQNKQYYELKLARQEHGAQKKAQRARAEAGLDPLTFTPLLPDMQRQLDTRNRTNSTNNPLYSKKRKLEVCAKNKQTVHDNPDLSATDKMSDGKHASICTCRTIPVMHIAV